MPWVQAIKCFQFFALHLARFAMEVFLHCQRFRLMETFKKAQKAIMDINLNGWELPHQRKLKNENTHSPKQFLWNLYSVSNMVLSARTTIKGTVHTHCEHTERGRDTANKHMPCETFLVEVQTMSHETRKEHCSLSRSSTELETQGWGRQGGRGPSRQKNNTRKGTGMWDSLAHCQWHTVKLQPCTCWNMKVGARLHR